MPTCECWQPRLRMRGPGNVGMVEITRNQTTEIAGIFSSAATPALMYQEFDAVDVLENPDSGQPLEDLSSAPLLSISSSLPSW